MEKAIFIDTIKPSESQAVDQNIDILEIEWSEAKENNIERKTKQGTLLLLKNKEGENWQDGDLLFSDGKCVALLQIKTCQAIQFVSDSLAKIAEFCYYIGNRHMPIFVLEEKHIFWMAYDEKIYKQLIDKFHHEVSLQEVKLLPKYLIRNVYEKNKVS